jgi:hypothetical protein
VADLDPTRRDAVIADRRAADRGEDAVGRVGEAGDEARGAAACGGVSVGDEQLLGVGGTELAPELSPALGWIEPPGRQTANRLPESGVRCCRRWGFHVSALAIAPTRPESIYAIVNASNGRTSHASIFKSTDAGKTWRATGGGAKVFTNQDGWGGELAVDPQHPTTVYASIGRTLLRTTDAGASWRPITQGLPQQVVTALTVDPRQSGTVYAGLSSTYKGRVISAMGGIYKTTNGGDTWTQALSGITAGTLAVDPVRPTTIYAAVHGRKERIARSTDGGRTWTVVP